MSTKSQHILFILDRSGSMSPKTNDVIGGFNTYLSEMRVEAQNDNLQTVVSLVTFADDHKVVFAAKPIADVGELTTKTYRAAGSTALLDAVNDSVTKYLEKLGQGEFGADCKDTPPVLVIVFTDGEENASTEVTWQQVQELIARCENLGNWTFTYVGAHPSAWAQADQLRINLGNVLDAQDMSVNEVTERLVISTKLHRAVYRDFGRMQIDNAFEVGNNGE